MKPGTKTADDSLTQQYRVVRRLYGALVGALCRRDEGYMEGQAGRMGQYQEQVDQVERDLAVQEGVLQALAPQEPVASTPKARRTRSQMGLL